MHSTPHPLSPQQVLIIPAKDCNLSMLFQTRIDLD